MKYSELLDQLDYELLQEKETADSASREKFRILPRSRAPQAINEELRYLCGLNDTWYTREILLEFFTHSATVLGYPLFTSETHYIDTDLNVSDNVFTIPEHIRELKQYIIPGTYTEDNQRDGRWQSVAGSTISAGNIYAPDKTHLFNKDGWADGYKLRSIATVFPSKVKNSIDTVEVVDVTRSAAGIFTIETAAEINLERGDIVYISDSNPDDYNGNYTVVRVSPDRKNFVITGTDTETHYVDDAVIGFNSDDLILDFPGGFERLLILCIKKKAYARKNKRMNEMEFYELTRQLMPQWINYTGQVATISVLNVGGSRIGRGR